MASSSSSSTSVYLNTKPRVLSKQQIDALVAHLDALDHGEILKLVNWMEFVRTILHQADSPIYKEWSQIEKNIGFKLSDSTRSAIITSL